MYSLVVVVPLFVLLLIVFKFFRRSKTFKKNENIISPFKKILLDLKIAKKDIGIESYESFAVIISNVLKKFLIKNFRYIKLEMTNNEIINALNKDASNDWKTLSMITEILSITEKVEFSKKTLSVVQQRGLYKKTCQVILKINRIKRKK